MITRYHYGAECIDFSFRCSFGWFLGAPEGNARKKQVK